MWGKNLEVNIVVVNIYHFNCNCFKSLYFLLYISIIYVDNDVLFLYTLLITLM